MKENIRVSIIICTRNRKEILLRICRSIVPQTYTNYEIVIVDSSDKNKITREDLENIFGKTTMMNIIYSEPGLTKQRNIGIKAAQGDLFFFFDDDLILEDGFLYEMVLVFKDNKQYFGGMGAMSDIKDASFKTKVFNLILRFFLLRHIYGNGKFQKSGFPGFPHGRKEFLETEILSGGITAYRKEVFDTLKFDEHFAAYSYMEDVDFSRRVSKKYKLFYNPKARAEHRHAEGGRGNYFENRRMYIYNHRYIFEKNFPQNISTKLAHLWSIIGLYFFAFWDLDKTVLAIKGYTQGLKDYKTAKKTRIFVKHKD